MAEAKLQDVRIVETPELLAQAVADAFIDDARTALAQRGAFFVALAGGTTPKAAYRLLAAQPRRSLIDWQRVQIFFSDERCVPPQDDESNYKMAAQAFLHALELPAENVHRMHGEDDPAEAAAGYARELIALMGERPQFDLVMLGMGPDGHTASLFPGTDPRTDERQLVRGVYVDKFKVHRITLTPLVINAARHVLIATEGVTKAPAVYAVLEGPYDPCAHPVQIVAPAPGRLTWLLDRTAAAELSPK